MRRINTSLGPKSLTSTLLITGTLSVNYDIFANINPLTAGAPYIRVFIFYTHIKYNILKIFKIKCVINQQDLKKVDLHFVKSE